MDTVGYCIIRKGATTGRGMNLEKFIGETCRVMEFASDGGVLLLDRAATSMATFDKVDVQTSFTCSFLGGGSGVLCPPDLNVVDRMIYQIKAINRKGGYPPLLREMVIQASLAMGKFTDAFLWQMQE